MVSRGPLAIWHGLLLLLLLPLPSHGGPALRPTLLSQVQEWDRVLCPACVSVSYVGALPSSLLSSSGLVAMPLPPSVSGMSLFRLTFLFNRQLKTLLLCTSAMALDKNLLPL